MRRLTSHLYPLHPSHAQIAPLMDKRVEILGTTRQDMNGKRGLATDFHYYKEDQAKCRYTIKLDSGEAVKVKPASLRAVDVRKECATAANKLLEDLD